MCLAVADRGSSSSTSLSGLGIRIWFPPLECLLRWRAMSTGPFWKEGGRGRWGREGIPWLLHSADPFDEERRKWKSEEWRMEINLSLYRHRIGKWVDPLISLWSNKSTNNYPICISIGVIWAGLIDTPFQILGQPSPSRSLLSLHPQFCPCQCSWTITKTTIFITILWQYISLNIMSSKISFVYYKVMLTC